MYSGPDRKESAWPRRTIYKLMMDFDMFSTLLLTHTEGSPLLSITFLILFIITTAPFLSLLLPHNVNAASSAHCCCLCFLLLYSSFLL